MNHTKTNKYFWGEKTSRKKVFSLNYSFSFLSSVLCLLTDNKVAQKTVREKTFSEKLVFWKKKHFNYLYPSSVPHWYFIPKISKKFSFLKVILCSKKVLKIFFSYLQISVTPLTTMSFKIFFHGRSFPKEIFSAI